MSGIDRTIEDAVERSREVSAIGFKETADGRDPPDLVVLGRRIEQIVALRGDDLEVMVFVGRGPGGVAAARAPSASSAAARDDRSRAAQDARRIRRLVLLDRIQQPANRDLPGMPAAHIHVRARIDEVLARQHEVAFAPVLSLALFHEIALDDSFAGFGEGDLAFGDDGERDGEIIGGVEKMVVGVWAAGGPTDGG